MTKWLTGNVGLGADELQVKLAGVNGGVEAKLRLRGRCLVVIGGGVGVGDEASERERESVGLE